MPSLLFYRGDRNVLSFPLGFRTGAVFKVGRHPTNDLTLPDEEISRFHAQVELRGNVFWILDRSRNGTFVNNCRVKSSPLRHKDQIQMGSWKILFTDDAQGGEKETAVQEKPKSSSVFCGMVGKDEVLQKVFLMIEKAAPSSATVLIIGETGTGKELVARAIHDLSPREKRPFVAINCGAISPQLIESEIFGHEKGAFTGALGRHAGAFEQARGGTLFLDEVGELPLELQPKLLRVLEERRFRRVGGVEETAADVRIVAATHRNLETLTREGKFREDLFFRLFSVPIQIPPLRERAVDIPLLAEYFLERFQSGGAIEARKKWAPETMEHLRNHPWKGNIRELKNVVTRSLLFAPGSEILPEDLLFLNAEDPSSGSMSLKTTEREAILEGLKRNDWNKKKTAKYLGVAKSTLFNKIQEHQIKKEG